MVDSGSEDREGAMLSPTTGCAQATIGRPDSWGALHQVARLPLRRSVDCPSDVRRDVEDPKGMCSGDGWTKGLVAKQCAGCCGDRGSVLNRRPGAGAEATDPLPHAATSTANPASAAPRVSDGFVACLGFSTPTK